MSRTPSSKYSRFALTVPTITLLPSTNSRLILSAGTSTLRSPPVTLGGTSTPFFARPRMLSDTKGEEAGGSENKSKGPHLLPPPRGGPSPLGPPASHAGEDEHAVLGEALHAVEHDGRVAGGLEDQIERPVLPPTVRDRHVGR